MVIVNSLESVWDILFGGENEKAFQNGRLQEIT
jgi:hypothetical protein